MPAITAAKQLSVKSKLVLRILFLSGCIILIHVKLGEVVRLMPHIPLIAIYPVHQSNDHRKCVSEITCMEMERLAERTGTVRLTIPDAGTVKFHVLSNLGLHLLPSYQTYDGSYVTLTLIGFD